MHGVELPPMEPRVEVRPDARRDLHADLSKLATKTKRSKRWVESFFRAGSKKPKTPPPAQ